MVGVVKIQIFLLLVPILHNSQLAAPRPHHQLQKKTLIIVVAHFLFLSYSLSLQLQMLQQLGFFSCRVEKKKKQQATSMDRTRQKRQNLSFFLLCFSNSGQISQDSNVDSLRDCWRIWAPSESTSMLQGKPVVRSAAHCYQTALCRRRAGVWKWKHGLGNLLLLAGMAPITLFCCSSRASFAGRMPAATASIFCPFPA